MITECNVPRIRMLSDESIEKVLNTAMDVLEDIGSLIMNDEARQLLLDANAKEIGDGIVSIPRQIIYDAIESAPKEITLYTRDGDVNMVLGRSNSYFGTCCETMDIMDPYTRERRKTTSKDWLDVAKVTDYLPTQKFMHLNGNALDMEADEAYREISYATIPNMVNANVVLCQGSHVVFEESIDIAEVIAGGPEELRAKPFIFAMAEPVSPLQHADDPLRRLLMCAERGVPIVYYGMQMQGVTAPPTGAGILVVSLAETLAGLAIHQLKRKGAPIIVGGIPGVMDLKTITYSYGAPELARNLIAILDVLHYLNLPTWGTSTSDSKYVDAQCGAEFGMSQMINVLAGADIIHDVAQMDQALLVSMEEMVLSDEIAKMCYGVVREFKIDDEELCVDMIKKVGHGGTFLREKATKKECKNYWSPYVFDRSVSYEGVEPIEERLNAKVREIIETYEFPPLPQEKLDAIAELKEKWDERLKNNA